GGEREPMRTRGELDVLQVRQCGGQFEVSHLGPDANRKTARIEILDDPRAAAARPQIRPGAARVVAHGRDHAKARDGDATFRFHAGKRWREKRREESESSVMPGFSDGE